MQYKNRKNLYKILFITILLGFTISLAGCSWLSWGLLNVFDPQAQLRVLSVDYTDESKTSLNLEVASINQVEFIGSAVKLLYYSGGTRVSSLDASASGYFYVNPSSTPGEPGESTEISEITLYTGEVLNYVKNNKAFNQVTCDVYLVGTDGAGHKLELKVVENISALGIDNKNPDAEISIEPEGGGECPITVIFDGSGSSDEGLGVATYAWELPQVQSGIISTSSTFSHTFPCSFLTDSDEVVTVALTVTDYHGNQDTDLESITITKAETGDESCPL